MRTVDDFARIRQAHRDGLSSRQIAKQFGIGRDTVRKALRHAEPPPYTLVQPRSAPVFGPFRPFVDEILAADETAPRKQRHTATQIYRRLIAEKGYTGNTIRSAATSDSDDSTAARPSSLWSIGRASCRGRLRPHPRRLPRGPAAGSGPDRHLELLERPFALALPTERTEAILHGLVEAFAFFECVPVELWWDNPKTVAIHLFQGRERTLHPRYAALAAHFPFTPKFCLPATATEKPRVEKRVFDLQRQWATPVPRVNDLAQLNAHLRRCCLDGPRANLR